MEAERQSPQPAPAPEMDAERQSPQPAEPCDVPQAPQKARKRKRYQSTDSDDYPVPSLGLLYKFAWERQAIVDRDDAQCDCRKVEFPPQYPPPVPYRGDVNMSDVPQASLRTVLGIRLSPDFQVLSTEDRRLSTKSLLRAVVHEVASHCYHYYMRDLCPGCVAEGEAQSPEHLCLEWTPADKAKHLNTVFQLLYVPKLLHLVICVGYSMYCLELGSPNVQFLLELLAHLQQSAEPQRDLANILKPADQRFVKGLQNILSQTKYTDFLSRFHKGLDVAQFM